jgi:hypothetical protein
MGRGAVWSGAISHVGGSEQVLPGGTHRRTSDVIVPVLSGGGVEGAPGPGSVGSRAGGVAKSEWLALSPDNDVPAFTGLLRVENALKGRDHVAHVEDRKAQLEQCMFGTLDDVRVGECAPWPAKCRATAAPMPLLPPVISATLPSMSMAQDRRGTKWSFT